VKKYLWRIIFVCFWCAWVSTASAAINVYVPRPSPAPNVFGSTSWAQYLEWAMLSLRYNLGDIGDRSVDPRAYHVLRYGYYRKGHVIVTSGPSWDGVANPLAPFAGEHGNRMHCGLVAIGDGVDRFTLRDVAFWFLSTNGDLDFSGTLSGRTFNEGLWGIDFGPDRIFGSPDDIVYSQGEGDTVLLDAIIYRGPGVAFWPDAPAGQEIFIDANNPDVLLVARRGAGGTLQGQIDEIGQYMEDNHYEITCGFSVATSPPVSITLTLPPDLMFGDGFED
jgi:hypothetical protein